MLHARGGYRLLGEDEAWHQLRIAHRLSLANNLEFEVSWTQDHRAQQEQDIFGSSFLFFF